MTLHVISRPLVLNQNSITALRSFYEPNFRKWEAEVEMGGRGKTRCSGREAVTDCSKIRVRKTTNAVFILPPITKNYLLKIKIHN